MKLCEKAAYKMLVKLTGRRAGIHQNFRKNVGEIDWERRWNSTKNFVHSAFFIFSDLIVYDTSKAKTLLLRQRRQRCQRCQRQRRRTLSNLIQRPTLKCKFLSLSRSFLFEYLETIL